MKDSVWSAIDLKNWRDIPVLVGRVAEEKDVQEGRATFYLQGAAEFARPKSLFLPRCAWLASEGAERTAIVIVQAEETEQKTYIGFRDLVGGNGICTLDEVEFVDAPDARFFQISRDEKRA
jgi:hypothetical protein